MSLLFISMFVLLIAAASHAKPENQVRFRRLPPKEFSAALGSSITIECEASSSPPPVINWLKDGRRIIQSESEENNLQAEETNRLSLSSTRSRLYIDCADYQDEAVYTCEAENSFSRIASHTKFKLLPAPPAASAQPSAAAAMGAAAVAQPIENAAPLEQDIASLVSDQQRSQQKQDDDSISAVSQCLRQNRLNSLRIHMWTHNIVELMKNNVVLYCRSNVAKNHGDVTWTLPDDKLVNEEHKDKYQILETGDLLIKNLNWSDMGSYVCTVFDEQTSDSVSTFVYPASVSKIVNKQKMTSNFR